MSADEHFVEGRKVRRRSGSAFGAVDFELCTVPENGWVSAEQLAKELNSHASLLAENEKLREALKAAGEALSNYACHNGAKAPCIRLPDQCRAECGKTAGDAALLIDAALGEPQ